MSAPPFSVLDLAPVATGSTTGEALRSCVDLAQITERLGYHRYWVAEHHNMPGIASSSPAVLVSHIAAATTVIRVGSGGVMLPNHPILVVAEQFGMIEALNKGRVDLGIGRAPGTDRSTAEMLRRAAEPASPQDFERLIRELVALFDGTFPSRHPYARIQPVPARGNAPEFWVLGSSDFSAQVAAGIGLPLAFAHHLGPTKTLPALALYRSMFRRSRRQLEPRVMVAVGVLCAGSDEEARHLAEPNRLSLLRLRQGLPSTLPSPEEAAAHPYTPEDLEFVETATAGYIVGGPDRVRSELDALITATRADEIMITTSTHDPADRIRSFTTVAEMYGLRPLD